MGELMEFVPTIISVTTFVLGVSAFFITRYQSARKSGAAEEKINGAIKTLQSEIDTRVASVCAQHDSDIEKMELKREYLSIELHNHINDNKSEHDSLFKTINDIVASIGEIKGDVKLVLSKLDEVRK